MDYVFVYGTLKTNYRNNRLFNRSTDRLISVTTTQDANFDLVGMGYIPGVIKLGQFKIQGELWSIDPGTLRALDYLESNGDFYTRERVSVDGSNEKPWMYILNGYWRSDNRISDIIHQDGNVKWWEPV